jgi:hypothetical protein
VSISLVELARADHAGRFFILLNTCHHVVIRRVLCCLLANYHWITGKSEWIIKLVREQENEKRGANILRSVGGEMDGVEVTVRNSKVGRRVRARTLL